MDSQDVDNATSTCSIIGLSVWVTSHPYLVRMEEPAPVSIRSAGPDIMISSVSVPSKNIQYHPLATGTMVITQGSSPT